MRKFKLTLEYDGTAYHGWQKQANALAIQNVVEDKLQILLKQPCSTVGAGRTDAGVHARMQVVSFAAESNIEGAVLLRGLNGLMPKDIRVTKCSEAPVLFDARRDAQQKTYHFYWLNRAVESPFYRRFSCFVPQPLDLAGMQKACICLLGKHDFSSFRAADCEAEHPLRTVMQAEVSRQEERIIFKITADAFLHHMVRILAGTLQEIGLGKRRAEEMKLVLEARQRKLAGPTAPAQGLHLWEVQYGAIPRPGRRVSDLGN